MKVWKETNSYGSMKASLDIHVRNEDVLEIYLEYSIVQDFKVSQKEKLTICIIISKAELQVTQFLKWLELYILAYIAK